MVEEKAIIVNTRNYRHLSQTPSVITVAKNLQSDPSTCRVCSPFTIRTDIRRAQSELYSLDGLLTNRNR